MKDRHSCSTGRVALATLLAAAAVSSSASAEPTSPPTEPASAPATASPSGNVPLSRKAPWDKWCVAPACVPTGAAPHAPLVNAPTSIKTSSTAGALEIAAKERAIAELQKLSAHALGKWNGAAMQDLVHAVLSAASEDEAGLERSMGVGAALARAALTLAVERSLAASPGCEGAARMDAVYEGLALSIVLSPLRFPQRTGAASAACVPVAEAAEQWADGMLARATVPPAAVTALGRVQTAADGVRSTCESATSNPDVPDAVKSVIRNASSSATPADLAAAAAQAKASAPAVESSRAKLGESCSKSLDQLAALGDAGLSPLTDAGLASADARALAAALGSSCPIASEGASAARLCQENEPAVRLLLALRGGLKKEDLSTAVSEIAASVGVSTSDDSLNAAILRACEQAIVVRSDGATLDQAEVVRKVADRYVPGLGLLAPSSFVFDVSAGVPSLDTNDVRIVGDATVGYRGSKFGVVGRGGANYFDIASNGVSTDNLHAFGAADGFWLSGTEQTPLRLETRLGLGLDYYDSTTIQAPSTSKFRFGDYDSLLLRGLLEVGFQWQPNERIHVDVRGGGGMQHETYETTSLDSKGINLTSPTTISGRGVALAALRWRAIPRYLAVRVRATSGMLSLTRETVQTTARAGVTTTTIVASSETQYDAEGRGFVDFDVVKFAGFVPAVWGGVNAVVLDSGSAVIPAAGIAIFRPGY